MAKSKKPTGLTIKRDNGVFKLSWKKGETYDKGQLMEYRTNLHKWTDVSISKTQTTKSVKLTASSYYPSTTKKVNWIEMRVRGKAKGDTLSDWSKKRYTINEPRKPVLTEYDDEATYYVKSYS